MPQTTYRNGSPVMVDHTPGSAVAAGDVVVINNVPHIAHRDIAAAALGALAVAGGVYEALGDAAIANGKIVYWDDTANKVTETNTNKAIGWLVTACAANNGKCLVFHMPRP